MKKVLAAVMAVAMAASMSAVAFAADNSYDSNLTITEGGSGANNGEIDKVTMGKEVKYTVETGATDVTDAYDTHQLARLMDNGYLSGDIIVTSGRDKLASTPSLKVVGNTAQMKMKIADTWGTSDVTVKLKTRFTAKKDVYRYANITVTSTVGTEYTVTAAGACDAGMTVYDVPFDEVNDIVKEAKKNFNDPTNPTATIKSVNIEGVDKVMKKGDTITSTEFKVIAGYYEVTNYGDALTVTPTESDDRYIIAKGEELYDGSGSGDKVIIYFGSTGDVASVEFKVSNAQKDLNLGYNTDEIEEVTQAYQNVDFEFLRFNTYQTANANVLTNTGTMTFNAIGGKNTTVYEWDGKTLTEKNSKFNSYDDTVTVEGIKRLTCYVVADQKLEAKVEETEAPATETQAPVTEPVTAPEPSTPTDNNENPNTGAL